MFTAVAMSNGWGTDNKVRKCFVDLSIVWPHSTVQYQSATCLFLKHVRSMLLKHMETWLHANSILVPLNHLGVLWRPLTLTVQRSHKTCTTVCVCVVYVCICMYWSYSLSCIFVFHSSTSPESVGNNIWKTTTPPGPSEGHSWSFCDRQGWAGVLQWLRASLSYIKISSHCWFMCPSEEM